MDSRIAILDESVANQIAAGEVIERPASVVKELVENALDAGASQVEVELENGGLKLIRVTDNGIGMTREETVISLQRHATSKIRNADDLFSIHTLGFRGEALPSIASVSKMEIISRSQDSEVGVRLALDGGEVTDLCEFGTPQGTRISVASLFYNTPARLKFMKSQQTELGHILDLISRMALSHWTVSFQVVHEGRQVFSSQGSPQLFNAIVNVYGRAVAREMIPIQYEDNALKIHGYASRPSLSRANRAQQSLFVNGRYVRSRVLIRSLDDAYHTMLTVGRYPLCVAVVEIDPRLVDVNVHPTKVEVRFLHEWDVHDALLKSIRNALGGENLIPVVDSGNDSNSAYVSSATSLEQSKFRQVLENNLFPNKSSLQGNLPNVDEVSMAESPNEGQDVPPGEIGAAALASIDLIGQLHNSYILAQTPDGMLLIDQHAAHERILLEKFLKRKMNGGIDSQGLLAPQPIQLNHREAISLEPYLPTLNTLGFQIEPFGGDCFLVRAVPALFGVKNPQDALRDVVDDLCECSSSHRIEQEIESETIKAVCKRAAIKAGDKMSYEEMKHLVADLLQAENPYTCAHGRPTMVLMSMGELLNRFKRT